VRVEILKDIIITNTVPEIVCTSYSSIKATSGEKVAVSFSARDEQCSALFSAEYFQMYTT
jgi:hypothetical protein